MPDNEMDEIHQRATAAVAAVIQAAGQLAQVLIDVRIAQLQGTARASDDRARRIRAQVRAAQQADAAIWRPATRPSWWRQASADDIARAWRASAGWAAVDPRAGAAQRVMVVRLAERGVHVNPAAGARPGDAGWLSDQLDRAALDDGDRSADPRAAGAGERRRTAQDRQEAMAVHVREVWTADRAERVIGSEAWPALAYKLDQLERGGHDVRALLRQVPGFVDRAHTPAAYAFRVVHDYATDQAAAVARTDANGGEERRSATLDGAWREAATEHTQDERVDAGRPLAGPAERDVHAAQLAAHAFPQSTKSVVVDTTAAPPSARAQQPTARSAAASVVDPSPGR
ncbi:hypothetical protein DLJ47_17990 [Micromonospora sp. S4605]|uniref:hypothetical protein n=1 Tax=Micromonospora sp. S4605 TaxID=1420897 RepID=UPI000D6F6CF7|nr:hypothetical protein [Micromonospora sp. S4605]PWU52741.1 hypothetical protein DLJ47_17990 [Micromonospora sp. S4605]